VWLYLNKTLRCNSNPLVLLNRTAIDKCNTLANIQQIEATVGFELDDRLRAMRHTHVSISNAAASAQLVTSDVLDIVRCASRQRPIELPNKDRHRPQKSE
jgi:hypothetical protein